MELIEKISETNVSRGEIALFYLAQAGFIIKTSGNKIIVIDAYLTDAAEKLFGFKRMIPKIIKPEEINADLYISTHSHVDHLDTDALPVISKNRNTFFVGSRDCEDYYKKYHIPEEKYHILRLNEVWSREGIVLRAVYADHGDLAPHAVGILIDIDGIKVYHAGDTSFCPEEIGNSLHSEIDILIVPINGKFGNLNASEACKLARIVNPKVIIASHFWMFLEHMSEGGAGDPQKFITESKELPKEMKAIVMAPGELFKYSNLKNNQ